ncbi:MAG: OmpA family protein [Planctomycetota bacterium]|jgi:chemotaxis protein MotB|nr:OmpA family protein [Planctomycetota bacterium]MDG2143190.1 OmpA family protein [Planctomycetota bacterium]
MAAKPESKKAGPPTYMVSFGDMMTLILTFFILLVSMSKEQRPGLVADGVGSFIVSLQTHGLNGILSGAEEQAIFDEVRQRFGLPPKAEEQEEAKFDMTSTLELLRTQAAEGLKPHDELFQPNIVTFQPNSAELDDYSSRRYLDRIASTVRPQKGQFLILEGHAADSNRMDPARDRELSNKRAEVVANYLIQNHNFVEERVEARAWLVELGGPEDPATRCVDARLVTPYSVLD